MRHILKSMAVAILLLFGCAVQSHAETVLFEDNFDSGSMSPEWVSKAPTQWVQDGWLHTKDMDSERSSSMAVVHDSDQSWTDYKISATAEFAQEIPMESIILLRTDGFYRDSQELKGSSYMLHFIDSPEWPIGHIIFDRIDNDGNHAQLFSGEWNNPDESVNIVILLDGSRIVLSINEQTVFDVVDPKPLLFGGIGVHTKGETYARFDNFKVTSVNDQCDVPVSDWTATGSMNTPRAQFTATLLNDGRVLAAGGTNGVGGGLSSAELYDPSTGQWSYTGSMSTARNLHSAVLLPNGKVLVVGGYDLNLGQNAFASAELYDPVTGTWSNVGNMSTGRLNTSATLLPNGLVLVAGGRNVGGGGDVFLSSAELYDPNTQTWTSTGSMNATRADQTATLLANGFVLVAGGNGSGHITLKTAELYNSSNRTWLTTGSMTNARWYHSATKMNDGRVIVVGGISSSGVLADAEIYNPLNGTWISSGTMNNARHAHTALLLPNGQVMREVT